jgi:hypothetical protein
LDKMDLLLKDMVKNDKHIIPDSLDERIERTLRKLPHKNSSRFRFPVFNVKFKDFIEVAAFLLVLVLVPFAVRNFTRNETPYGSVNPESLNNPEIVRASDLNFEEALKKGYVLMVSQRDAVPDRIKNSTFNLENLDRFINDFNKGKSGKVHIVIYENVADIPIVNKYNVIRTDGKTIYYSEYDVKSNKENFILIPGEAGFNKIWKNETSDTVSYDLAGEDTRRILTFAKGLKGNNNEGQSPVDGNTLPELVELFKNVAAIDITFDKEVPSFAGHKPVKTKDSRVIEDISMMLQQAKVLSDESRINNMSGGSSRKHKILLTYNRGSNREIDFGYDDLYNFAFMEIDSKIYELSYDLIRYLRNMNEYNYISKDMDISVIEVFLKHNWTVNYRVNAFKERLPENLLHDAGEYPYKLYWAYNNELSKSIGLDFTSYLGKEVEISIYSLREPLPEFMKPRLDARGVVLRADGRVIGAFIDAGRHEGFACSLHRKSLQEITGKSWDEWISSYINYEYPLEVKLSKMSHEELIKEYFNALNNKDRKTVMACETRRQISQYMFINLDNNKLINRDEHLRVRNIKSVKLLEIKEGGAAYNDDTAIQYRVKLDYQYEKEITAQNGITTAIVTLRKESEKSGWRIADLGN